MNYLIVVAHPDDEVLGAGGTIQVLKDKGHKVYVVIFCGDVEAREKKPNSEEFKQNIKNVMKALNVDDFFIGKFPNIKLNNIDHIELVKYVESIIIATKSQIIITHHPADLNNDHYHVSIACQTASKINQRRDDLPSIKALLFMEILSSTDWYLNTSMKQFTPNMFIQIGDNLLNRKIEILNMYKNVMRLYPHPRSSESIRGLAAYRGSQSGQAYCEAFECVYFSGIIESV